ncbi:F pilus assembly protein TraC [Legionella donaldsonii]|uniref:F pilus assembly protein TraC n=1 Tax=Legionella donaldsonii TaxID=45060 RepID=A0A378J078_9GAMM|nr:F pilus assembly protein TraC [Legionella donaldsonii]
MQARINQLRDRIRLGLHLLSTTLGEGSDLKPPSLVSQANAAASVELDLPSIQSLLPYERVNEAGFFVNRSSLGFGLQVMPLSGADETLMNTLASLFKNRLTEGVDCTVLLYKHPWLSETLSSNYAPYFKAGGIMAELAGLSLRYHDKARQEGYPNNLGIPATLSDYCCFLFVSVKSDQESALTLSRLREDFEAELKVAGLNLARLSEDDFATLLRALLSPNFSQGRWPATDDEGGYLSDRLLDGTALYEIDEQGINLTLADSKGEQQSARLINCELKGLPKQPFALWQSPDLFANLLSLKRGIDCPFLLSLTVRGINQDAAKAEAKSRAKSLTANSNAIQRMMHPGIIEEAAEWRFVHEQADKGELHLLPVFYNLTLYTTREREREQVAKAIGCYESSGFKLVQSRLCQWPRFLTSLPFLSQEGLFKSLEQLGLTKRLTHWNVANLLPVVADSKGSAEGLLLPTCRNQIFFLNTFDDRTRAISNYNQLTVAGSGAGKSFFQQAQILDGLARGEQIFVIDLGDSYKHLCELVGGTYLDAASLSLNPFTLFDFEGSVEVDGNMISNCIQIRDLLAIMASPDAPVSPVQKKWLLQAVRTCWKAKGRASTMDDILTTLRGMLPDSDHDVRLKDLLLLLDDYGAEGLYGALFNAETPLLTDSRFVVLEMGGLKDNPELLKIVLYVMIVIIQGQFYQSDRRKRKRCVIDEAWQFLAKGANPVQADFIAHGFRTARKYNAGFTVVTQIQEDTDDTPQARAVAACSDTKIIMRQENLAGFIASHPKLLNPLQQELLQSFGKAKLQGFSNLMICSGNHTTFHRFFCDPFSRVLFSTSGDEFGAIEALLKEGVPLTDAVARVTQHYYPEHV